MLINKPIIQPVGGTTIDALGEVVAQHGWECLLVSAAYATRSGLGQLVGQLRDRWPGFDSARKTFHLGLDFGLTEPEVLEDAARLHSSTCYLHDANATLAASLHPAKRFHPKVYVVGDAQTIATSSMAAGILGSANLTASGLIENTEASVAFIADSSTQAGSDWLSALAALEAEAWAQPPLTQALLISYQALRHGVPTGPSRTLEQVRQIVAPGAEFDDYMLRALRGAHVLWTQTLKIVENRGRGVPGNQVDMKKGVRVFFGLNVPMSVPPNTPLGMITTVRPAGVAEQCNVRFGNNQMEKINLPVGSSGNHPAYDHSFLAWTRVVGGAFELDVTKQGDHLVAASHALGTLYSYSGGARMWGFF